MGEKAEGSKMTLKRYTAPLAMESATGQFVRHADLADLFPIFDILPRLWALDFITVEQDGRWWLFDKTGDGVISGETFRDLCVNIVLAGL